MRHSLLQRWIAVGFVLGLGCKHASGGTGPNPAIALSVNPTSATVVQGGSTTVTGTLTRSGGFTDAVSFVVTGVPSGTSAAVANIQTTGAVTTASITIQVGAATPPTTGTPYTIVVTGKGSGVSDAPASFSLTVTAAPSFTLAITPTGTVSLPQGSVDNSKTVTINRTNYAAAVTLTAEIVPAPVTGTLTAAFAPPNPTTGNSSGLTLTASATLTPTTYHLTIRGTGPAALRAKGTPVALEATATFDVTVTAVTPTAVTADFSACVAGGTAPVWLAMQDGIAGAWAVVTGTNGVFHFSITQPKGGIAWVVSASGITNIMVSNYTQAEMTAAPLVLCQTTTFPTLNSVTGAVSNLAAGATGIVSFGGGQTTASANGSISIANVKPGANDLVGYMKVAAMPLVSDRVFIDRGLNPANGGSVGTVDFTGAKSFPAVFANATLTGGDGGGITVAMLYYTGTGANACTPSALWTINNLAGSTFIPYGFPTQPFATDFHGLSVTDLSATDFRSLTEYFHDLPARAAAGSFTLPPLMGTLVPTLLGGPYKRFSVTSTFSPEFNTTVALFFSDQTVTTKGGSLTATGGWLAGGSATLVLPDFSALAGWNNIWAPASGDAVRWNLQGSGATTTGCQEGGRQVFSRKTGAI